MSTTPDTCQAPSTPEEQLVESDIREGLASVFKSEGAIFEVLSDGPWTNPISNGSVTAVVWRYTTTPEAELIGPLATPKPVAIDGTSFLITSENPPKVMRFIDWFTTYSNLGLISAARIPDAHETEADPAKIAAWLQAQQTAG